MERLFIGYAKKSIREGGWERLGEIAKNGIPKGEDSVAKAANDSFLQ